MNRPRVFCRRDMPPTWTPIPRTVYQQFMSEPTGSAPVEPADIGGRPLWLPVPDDIEVPAFLRMPLR